MLFNVKSQDLKILAFFMALFFDYERDIFLCIFEMIKKIYVMKANNMQVSYKSFTHKMGIGMEEDDRVEIENILMQKMQDHINNISGGLKVNQYLECRITNVETVVVPRNAFSPSNPYILTIMHVQITVNI